MIRRWRGAPWLLAVWLAAGCARPRSYIDGSCAEPTVCDRVHAGTAVVHAQVVSTGPTSSPAMAGLAPMESECSSLVDPSTSVQPVTLAIDRTLTGTAPGPTVTAWSDQPLPGSDGGTGGYFFLTQDGKAWVVADFFLPDPATGRLAEGGNATFVCNEIAEPDLVDRVQAAAATTGPCEGPACVGGFLGGPSPNGCNIRCDLDAGGPCDAGEVCVPDWGNVGVCELVTTPRPCGGVPPLDPDAGTPPGPSCPSGEICVGAADGEGGLCGTEQTIGSDGGTIAAPWGAIIQIPAGALGSELTFTAAPGGNGGGGALPVGQEVTLEPSGTTFGKPITVTMAFDPGMAVGVTAADVRIYAGSVSGVSPGFAPLPTTPVDATHVAAQTSTAQIFFPGVPMLPADGGFCPPARF